MEFETNGIEDNINKTIKMSEQQETRWGLPGGSQINITCLVTTHKIVLGLKLLNKWFRS